MSQTDALKRRKELLTRTAAHLLKSKDLIKNAADTTSSTSNNTATPTAASDTSTSSKKKKQLVGLLLICGLIGVAVVTMSPKKHVKHTKPSSVQQPTITRESLQNLESSKYPKLSSTLPAEAANATSAIPINLRTSEQKSASTAYSRMSSSSSSLPSLVTVPKLKTTSIVLSQLAQPHTNTASALNTTPSLNNTQPTATSSTTSIPTSTLQDDTPIHLRDEVDDASATTLASFTIDEKALVLSQLQTLQEQNLQAQSQLTHFQTKNENVSEKYQELLLASQEFEHQLEQTTQQLADVNAQVQRLLQQSFTDSQQHSAQPNLRIIGSHQVEIDGVVYHIGDPLQIKNKKYIILKINIKDGVYVQDKAGRKFKLRENTI